MRGAPKALILTLLAAPLVLSPEAGLAYIDNVLSLSVNPGIDVEVPVNDTWSLKPFASAEYGTALDANDSARPYRAGVKNRVLFRSMFDL